MAAGAKERAPDVFAKAEAARTAGTPVNPPRTDDEHRRAMAELDQAVAFYKMARDESNRAVAAADLGAARDAAVAARKAVETLGPGGDPKAKQLYDAGKAKEAEAEQASRAGSTDIAASAYLEAQAKYEEAAAALQQGADVAAKTARAGMQVAKEQAAAARAQDLAAKEWEEANVTEKVAEGDFAAGKFGDARKAFEAARAQYAGAAKDAEDRARDPDYAEALAAQKQMEEAKDALAKSGKPPKAPFYTWARDKEKAALDTLKAGDFVRAKELFVEARKRYLEAAGR